MEGEVFGTTAEGETVHRYHITGGGLTATVMEWGAVLQDLRLDGHNAPLVLGFDRFEDYPASSPYFGAIAGRYANRIANGKFIIDGHRFRADTNFLGKHTLHGGAMSTGKRLWSLEMRGSDFITLRLHDPDGFMGFPGNLEITCTYRLKLPGTLSIELSATTDQPTLCNLTNHSYFNLDDGGADSVLDHRLVINAGAYLPVDDELEIATGINKPASVKFKLTNRMKTHAKFRAFFSSDSSVDFSVNPKNGELEPYGREGTSIEVLDLRGLNPIDFPVIFESVKRTGRLVIAHEASKFMGLGAEIAAQVTHECFYHLEAPVIRVAGYSIPYPSSKLEEVFLPDLDRVLDGVDRALAY